MLWAWPRGMQKSGKMRENAGKRGNLSVKIVPGDEFSRRPFFAILLYQLKTFAMKCEPKSKINIVIEFFSAFGRVHCRGLPCIAADCRGLPRIAAD